ncbi:UbiA family prenyltransferase [Nocardia sp. NPDC127606]|uniref:UbiA family prenyltransferase n=1 Tax=Nocardia sp. NPDC127606 TaxID=3345406 RepID=UPI003632C444
MATTEVAADWVGPGDRPIRPGVGDFARLIRIQAVGFEGFSFAIGPLLTGVELSIIELSLFWLLGILINGYIFALNDFIDLPRDRNNPARAASPLVSGKISPAIALILSISFPLIAVAVIVAVGWPPTAVVAFAFFLILGAVVNVYQKATDRPILMDSLFAVTMAAPIPVAAVAYTDRIPAVVWIATVFMFLLALELNSIAGNLKDLSSDLVTGFRTVAVMLGAKTTPDGHLEPGPRYRRYCVALHGITVAVGLSGVAVSLRGFAWTDFVVVAICVTVSVVGSRDLYTLLVGSRRPSRRGREGYFAAGFILMTIVIALNADLSTFLYSMVVLLSWELLFGIRRYRSASVRRGD